MKLFKCLAAASAAVILLSSCSVLKGAASDATSTGSNTGSALVALYKILKATGNLDLSDLTNIINIGKVLIGANSLTNATDAFTSDFTSGLMNGSSQLINSANAGKVVNGLKALANIDTSALANAAAAAANGNAFSVNNSNAEVSSTISSLTSILKMLD